MRVGQIGFKALSIPDNSIMLEMTWNFVSVNVSVFFEGREWQLIVLVNEGLLRDFSLFAQHSVNGFV